MSIYATIGSLYFRARTKSGEAERFHKVTLQSVPAHIGSPEDYDEDPYSFLPPPVSSDSKYARAVVFIGPDHKKGTERSGQEYVNPLFTTTGEEYEKTTFVELWERIVMALTNQGYEVN